MKGCIVSVLETLNALVGTLPDPNEEIALLIETSRALALEIDMAAMPDENGRTKSAASAVRELRAVVDDMMTKGRRDADNDDDWSTPVADLAAVRDTTKRKPGDARPRSRGGSAAAG